jgi:hypothetical protein
MTEKYIKKFKKLANDVLEGTKKATPYILGSLASLIVLNGMYEGYQESKIGGKRKNIIRGKANKLK